MAKSLKQLGDELDAAESAVSVMMSDDSGTYFFSPDNVSFEEYEAIMKRRHDAELAYGLAVVERERVKRDRFKNRKTPLTSADGFRLNAAKVKAEARIDEIVAARPDFATMREFIDANAAYVTSELNLDRALDEFFERDQIARRRELSDRANNIVRRNIYRRSKPQ